ncbi:MAG: IS66 family transposase [Paracoccaceae bacterium]|nr:IS66 family transposase [Paracoccaceae bacterium]
MREFLADWLGIVVSKGVISKCLAEGGRAAWPLEDEFITEIQQSELLYVDETGWKENGKRRWLWVLKTTTVTYYLIGSRSWQTIADIMENFAGWLMSDGYGQYRNYGQRLRCLAHLIRKARGVSESCHPEAAAFGQKVLEIINLFINGIYEARGDPALDLMARYAEKLAQLKTLCQQYRDHEHEKTKKLARELLNDWATIWNVLRYPHLPLTNNLAERALRHWVISRKISYGTRTQQGSRSHAILASVIDTCRQRHVSPWAYIARVIAERRQNKPVPSLPDIAV